MSMAKPMQMKEHIKNLYAFVGAIDRRGNGASKYEVHYVEDFLKQLLDLPTLKEIQKIQKGS
jgi:hypothetical protein